MSGMHRRDDPHCFTCRQSHLTWPAAVRHAVFRHLILRAGA